MTLSPFYNKSTIRSIIGMLIALLLSSTLLISPAQKETPTDTLRKNWMHLLTGGDRVDLSDPDVRASIGSVTDTAKKYWDSIRTTADRTSLWTDYPSNQKTTYITSSYNRLRAMALAYASSGSTFYHNQRLLTDTIQALDWLNAHWYNDSIALPTGKQTPENNWWDYEIGVPLALNDILVLLYDQLNPDQIHRYTNAIGYFVGDCSHQGHSAGFNSDATGANLVWKCEADILRGILSNNSQVVEADRKKLSPVFAYANEGDGFHTDGSFIQHNVFAYTAGYGSALYTELTKLVYLLAGSPWDLNRLPGYGNLFKWMYDSFEPLVYKGAISDMVRGREISRSSSDLSGGEALVPIVALLSSFAPADDAVRLKSIVKQWMADLHPGQSYRSSNIFYSQQVNAILHDSSIKPRGGLTISKVFPAMDRVMHQRPDFAFGISMFSSRIADYESINHENLRAWYTGFGMTYLYTADDPHPYSNSYWPTVDPYRLPGTTVETGTRADSAGAKQKSGSDWAGGVSLGSYSSAGMALKDVFSPLQALKSWFMFDQEIVALGAGITDPTANPVESMIDNRQLNGNEILTVDGTAKPVASKWSETLSNVGWVQLSGKNIGYYFPGGATVTALREPRTGAWKTINAGYSANPITQNYLTLLFNHGAAPSGSTYSYVLLPNKSSGQVKDFAAKPDVRILANTEKVQAVQHTGLQIVGANFWTNQSVSVQIDGKDFLTSDGKASVMTRESSDQLQLSVSDPTQKGAVVNLEIQRAASSAISTDPGITVVQLKPTVKLRVNVKNTQGRTLQASFRK